MKIQKLAQFFQIIFIALLVVGALNQGGAAAYIAGVYLWVMIGIYWVIMLTASLSYLSGGAFERHVFAHVRPFFISDKSVIFFRHPGLRVLIALSLSASGFYISLVAYVMTMAVGECCCWTFSWKRTA